MVTAIPYLIFNLRLQSLNKRRLTMLFLGLFNDRLHVKVKQRKITLKSKSDKYIEI